MGLVGDEVIVQVAGQELGCRRLPHHYVDDVLSAEPSAVAQEFFLAVVVVFRLVLEAPVEPAQRVAGYLGSDGPAGERAGRLFNVVLGVVAHSHGEQLQQFPAPVLVDCSVVVPVVVQPVDHGRVLGQFHQQVVELAQAMLPEHLDLLGNLRGIVHLGVAGGEQLVPEEGHLLFQRPLGVHHPVHPFRLIGGRTQRPFQRGEEAVKQFVVNRRLVFGVEQLFNGGFVSLGGARLQFCVGSAETCPPHQVGHQGNFVFGRHLGPSSISGQANRLTLWA